MLWPVLAAIALFGSVALVIVAFEPGRSGPTTSEGLQAREDPEEVGLLLPPSRPVWKTRVGYVLWATVATLLVTSGVIKFLLYDPICGESSGGVWVCRRMRTLTSIGTPLWAVALTYIGVWWETGRINQADRRRTIQLLLVVLTLLALIVLIVWGLVSLGEYRGGSVYR